MKHKLKLTKKGGIFDIPFAMMILLSIALIFIFIHLAYRQLHEKLADSPLTTGSSDTAFVLEKGRAMYDGLDYGFVIIFVGLLIYIVISVGILESRPAFLPFVLIIGTIFIIASFSFANLWEEIEKSPLLQNETDTFGATSHIMNNMPFYMTGMVIVLIVFLYAKFKMEGST